MSPPEPTVAGLLQQSFRVLRLEAPAAYRALCGALLNRDIGLRIGVESMGLRSDGRDIWVCHASSAAVAHVEANLGIVLDIIEGRSTLLDALLDGRLAARAVLDDTLALHDGLMAYVHGAATSPSCAPLRQRLAEIAGRGIEQHQGRAVEAEAILSTSRGSQHLDAGRD